MKPVQQLQTLINQRRYQEVFALCDTLLVTGTIDAFEVFRMRAYAYAMTENYLSAVEDVDRVIDQGIATLSDYFLAATWALYIPDIEKADVFLHKVMKQGEASNNKWFRSSVYFYSAYIELERSDFNSALRIIQTLERSNPDISLPLPHIGMTSLEQLKVETRRRGNF